MTTTSAPRTEAVTTTTHDTEIDSDWSHSKITVLLGVLLGLVITTALYLFVLLPFLNHSALAHEFWAEFLTFVGTLFVLLCIIGKLIQRRRLRTGYYDAVITTQTTHP